MSKTIACVALLLWSPTPVFPCSVLTIIEPPKLVERAELILRARADGEAESRGTSENALTRTPGQIRFHVLEVIKGPLDGGEIAFNGKLVAWDDWNDRTVPYEFIRRGGRGGNCFALDYRAGAEYLLLLKKTPSGWSPYWNGMSPTNEQVRREHDAWVQWVRREVQR